MTQWTIGLSSSLWNVVWLALALGLVWLGERASRAWWLARHRALSWCVMAAGGFGAVIAALGLASRWFGPAPLALAVATLGLVAIAGLDWLRNAISAVVIATSRRIAPGDVVRIGEHEGEVERFSLWAVRLRTHDGVIVEVPNQRVASEAVVILRSGGKDLRLEVEIDAAVALAAGISADQVRRWATWIVLACPYASPRHEPQVHVVPDPAVGGRYHVRIRAMPVQRGFAERLRDDVLLRIDGQLARLLEPKPR